MAVYEDREAFIPYRRTDLIELCLEEGQLAATDAQKFRDFCTILAAYYHFQFHQTLETLKDNFAPFNPDADTKAIQLTSLGQKQQMADRIVTTFEQLLEKANYVSLSQASLQQALQEKSLLELNTKVNFDDFEQMVCYCRGDIYKKTWVKKLFGKVERTVDIFERVALLLKFKDADYFLNHKIKLDSLNFMPGQMYVYLYKNIPKFDIEFLFPNVKISMTLRDRLFLIIPAIGAAIPVMIKALPQLLLIIGIVLFFADTPPLLDDLRANEEQVRNFLPVLLALLSLVVVFGGFTFKQYTNYKNKQIRFQKDVTDTLFFKNIASNMGVFHALIDAAEEEECKEVILVYYHLLTHQSPLTPQQLDDRIETWMEQKLGTKVDFDIQGPLRNLARIRGKVLSSKGQAKAPELPLLSYDSQGCCQVLPLDDAKTVLDYIWDKFFLYSSS
ncbi:MAG: DUF3754 domain-containing protein [Cyanothece sp. SIO1E1]|nr:DUF3754 domain-containing protein [Cyanothece sp. SIO1E1]